jgi:hypothetical protein
MEVICVMDHTTYQMPADDLVGEIMGWVAARERLTNNEFMVSFEDQDTLDQFKPKPIQFVVVECRHPVGRRWVHSGNTIQSISMLRHRQSSIRETEKRRGLVVFMMCHPKGRPDVRLRGIMRAIITVPDARDELPTFKTSSGDYGELDMASLGDASRAKPLWVVE